MKRIYYIIIILLGSYNAFCQNTLFNLNVGYGSYSQNDLKNFQEYLIQYTDIKEKATESFPNFINYSVSLDYMLKNKDLIGFGLSYYTTGARSSVSDYSGSYKFDMILNGYAVSLNYNFLFSKIKTFDFYIQLKAGLIISDLKLNETLNIYETTLVDDKSNFRSENFFFEPSVIISYNIINHFYINFHCGYEIDIEGKIHLKDNKDAILSINGENVGMNWGGIRISIGASYKLR
jgi:hypothetical protein